MIPVDFVFACDQLTVANGQSTCVIMPFSGQTGVWFTLNRADELRVAFVEVPTLKAQIKQYDLLVGEYKRSLSNYQYVADARGDTIEDLQKALAKETQRANDAVANANPWYTNPILWGVVGFAGGFAVSQLVSR